MRENYLILCIFVITGAINCQYYLSTSPKVKRSEHDETVHVGVYVLFNTIIKKKGLNVQTSPDEPQEGVERDVPILRKKRVLDDEGFYPNEDIVCDPPWQLLHQSCVQFIKAKPFKSWQEARDFCLANNADLLSINDKAEKDSIGPLLREHVKSVDLLYWWLGLKLSVNGTWYWVDKEELNKYLIDWGPNSGKTVSGDGTILTNRCGVLDFSSNLRDEGCEKTKPFICEQIKLRKRTFDCKNGYVMNSNKSACVKGQLGSTSCSDSSNLVSNDTRTCAEVFSTGSTCVSSICECSKGYVMNSENSACVKGLIGTTTCVDDSNLVSNDSRTCAEVFSTGSTCVSSICECSKGYVMNSEKSACVKGQLGTTTCVDGSNLVFSDTRTCAEVFSTGSTCLSSICACFEGYVMISIKSACVKGQLGVTSCADGSNLVSNDTRTCAEVFATGSTCVSSVCECFKGYVMNSEKSACEKGQLGVTSCVEGSNLVSNDTRTCAEVFSTGSTCVSSICVCSKGYVMNSEKSACIKGQLGVTSCVESSNLVLNDTRTCVEVFSTGSPCVSSICACSKGYVMNSEKSACVKGQLGTTTCVDGSNLVSNDTRTCAEVFSTRSTCVSSICECSKGYVMSSEKSACVKGQLGTTTCVDGSNLVSNDTWTCAKVFSTGSTCVSSICECSKGYVMNSEKSACVKAVSCIQLSNPENGKVTIQGIYVDDKAKFFCNTGFYWNGMEEWTCLQTGLWDHASANALCKKKELGTTSCSNNNGTNQVDWLMRTCADLFSNGSICMFNVCTCSSGYVANTEKTSCEQVCECSEDLDYMGTYWKATLAGKQNYSFCPEGFTGLVTRFCDENCIYQPPVYNCTSNELTEILNEVNENDAFNSTKVLAQLVDATADNSKNNGTLLVGDVDAVNAVMVKITDAISTHSDQVLDLTEPFLNVANNLLRENTTTTWAIKINKTGEGVNTLLDNVDMFMEKIVEVTNATNFSSTQFTKTNLYVKLGSTASCVNGIRFPDRNKDKAIPEWTENTQDLLEILCNHDDTIKSYSSVIYRNISNLIPLTKRMQTGAESTGPIKLDAPVISFSFWPRDDRKLDTPIRLTFQLFTKESVDPVCSFWTKEESSDRGYWSSDGCVLASHDRTEGIVVCKCDHLTNFAVLTSPSSISVDDHHIVLSIISIVGCIVSMIALFITVIVHIIFWRNVKSVRTIINVNLCCTLFVAYLLFMTGIDQTENQDACKAVAVLLHFLYLAAFIIMLVEGLSLAYCVFKPLSTRKPGIPLLIAAYVVAVVIVCVSMGAVQLDGYGTPRFCWLSTRTGLIWAFVGPVMFVIFINIVIVVAVVYRMCGTAAMSRKTNKEKAKAGLRSVLVLMPLMGVTWLFGVFSINGETILFQYLFAIFNSLQGLFIFIFHCCMNSKIREAFKRSRLGKRYMSSASEAGPSKSAINKNTSNTDL